MKKTYILGLVVIIIALAVIFGGTKKSDGTLKIGLVATLSGNAAYYGESTVRGAEIARDVLASTHPDIKIELLKEDNLFTPQGGIQAYNKLRNIGHVDTMIVQASNVAVAIQPLAAKDNVLLFATSVLANNYTSPDDLSFRLTAKGDLEAAPMVDYMLRKGYTRAGLIYMTNEIGTSLRESLFKAASGTSLKFVADEGFPADAGDFRTQLTKAKQANVQVIYVVGLASHTTNVLKQLKELSYSVPIVGYRTMEDPTLIKNAGANAEGVVYTNSYDPKGTDPKTAEFERLHREKYGETSTGYAAESYEAVMLIAEAYKKCGSDKSCTKDFLFGIKDKPSIFGALTFDRNGDVTYPFFLKTVKNGEFVRLVE